MNFASDSFRYSSIALLSGVSLCIVFKFSELGEGVTGEMTQKDPSFGKVHDAGTMARIYGITKAEIDDKLKIQTVFSSLIKRKSESHFSF